MKNYLIALLLLMPVLSMSQTYLTITFSQDDFNFEGENVLTISTQLKEKRVIGDTLSPNLPFFPYRIKLPDYVDSVSLSVRYEMNILASNVKLAANPRPSIRDGRTNTNALPRLSTRSLLSPVINAGVKRQYGVNYLLLYVTPFLYDLQSEYLYFVNEVQIEFQDLPSTLDTTPISLSELFSVQSENSTNESIQQPRTGNDSIDYLIITNNSLKSSFDGLMQWKQRKSLRCKIVTKEEIDTLYPQITNSCARIKAYILDYASPLRKKWVLLGGDDSVIPSKLCPNLHYPFFSDFYYTTDSIFADVEWNTVEDHLIADYDMTSYNPYVYLSRLPVRTAQQVQDYTEKLIDYEMGVGVNDNMLLAGFKINQLPDSNALSDSHILNKEIFEEFVSNNWNGDLSYIYDTGTSFRDTNNNEIYINGVNLKNVLDNCNFNIIHEISHGDTTCLWVHNFGIDNDLNYNNSHAQAQTNYPGSVIVTGACLANQFEAEPCLSESLLRNPDGGAVAYFGSSGYGDGGEKDNSCTSNYIPLMYSDQYDGHFLQYLYTGVPADNPYSLAAIATEAKCTVYNEFHITDYYKIYQYLLVSINTMGDPEMQIYTSTPKSFIVTNNFPPAPTIPTVLFNQRTGYIKVTSTTDSCRIVVVNGDGTIHYRDNTQMAEFHNLSGLCKVTILRHNYKPYLVDIDFNNPGTFPITGTLGLNIDQTSDNLFINLYRDTNGIVSETEVQDNVSMSEWTLSVTNAITNERKCQVTLQESSCNISTSGWSSGIYVIRATQGMYSCYSKIIIR